MQTVAIEPRYDAWRARARALLVAAVPPDSVLWEDGERGNASLFEDIESDALPAASGKPPRIPRAFMELAELVSCHRTDEKWGLLYRVAWRLTHGGERQLMQVRVDADVRKLEGWAAAVRRDRHKMKAFVRFRQVGEASANRREQFVAWFEPEHAIVELTAPFFAKRFANMDWSILTPLQCAHWDGATLRFTEGVPRAEAPREDALEEYWRSYYAHIFNPARLKLDAMQSEMPKKYWKNLPEAPLIAELTSKAANRVATMVEAPTSRRAHVSARLPAGVPPTESPVSVLAPVDALQRGEDLSWEALRTAARHCQACPLHERATQTVLGTGPEDAEIMLVGEQPGDAEDLAGAPFVGPAGALLDEALTDIGLDRDALYITNTVKHFKWRRERKRRLHQTPTAQEVHVCRPWVLAEIMKVRPRVLICLGATAAKALIHPKFAMAQQRGPCPDCQLAERVWATWHPAYFLRMPGGQARDRQLALWKADLAKAIA